MPEVALPPPPSLNRATMLRLLGLAAAVAVVAFFVWRSNPTEIGRQIGSANAWWLAAALLLNLPLLLLAPLRSVLVLRRLDRHVSFRHLLPATILGYIAGSLTPVATGDLLRVGALRTIAGVDLERGITLIVYERAVSTYLLLASVLLCLALRDLEPAGQVVALILFALALFMPWLAGCYLLVHLPTAERINGEGLSSRLLRSGLAMAANVRFLLRDLPLLLAWSAMTFAIFAGIALEILCLAKSISADVSFLETWIAFGAYSFATIASLLPLGLGVGDGSLAAALHALGATLEQGASIAILLRATSTVPQLLIAFGCYLYLSRVPLAATIEERPPLSSA